jgi:hypothetical protein
MQAEMKNEPDDIRKYFSFEKKFTDIFLCTQQQPPKEIHLIFY